MQKQQDLLDAWRSYLEDELQVLEILIGVQAALDQQ